MEPLIITACDPLITPLINTGEGMSPEETVAATVQAICDSSDAGAAISHHHGLYTYTPDGGYSLDEESTSATVLAVREKSDIIIQMGGPVASQLASEEGQRVLTELWREAPLDMVSVVLNQIEFLSLGMRRVRTREEVASALVFCQQQGVKPEFEIWGMGDIWNLKYLLAGSDLQPPFWIEMLHGAEGAAWSPATIDETLHRAAYLPDGCLWHANAYTAPKGKLTPEEHTRFLTEVIIRGGHVRIGKEDRPEIVSGREADTNAELVEHIASIARQLGRPLATASQARAMLGLPERGGQE